ncbi:MAG: transposase, partial [Prevotellaceae bacterium]|nr:transposase [Prevotellaceae bacterium]
MSVAEKAFTTTTKSRRDDMSVAAAEKAFISKRWQEDLYKYITGIVQNNGHKLLCIGGFHDHVHLFFG